MVRIKKCSVEAYKRGRLGERQMEIKEFNVIKKVKKLTYSQDWTAYNQAKTKEKTISMHLLTELLDIVGEPKRFKIQGRPSFQFKEKIICMFIYSFSQFSSRKTIADIEMAKRLKLISKTPHFNSVLNMFKEGCMNRKLLELVEITSLPLRMFEDHLSIDSSGFSTSMFEKWLNIRTQKNSNLRQWMKCHIICGARTNIIASVKISEGHGADSPELIPLVKKAVKHFNPKEISADKAYLSRDNLQAISSVGAIPYIPFKKNSISKPRGYKIWSTMFEYFYNNQKEFMDHYHNRSNVETTFAMIKRNFGNHLRTRNFTSQINEILMKCLCHNLSVLVQESFELGLEIDFNSCIKEYKHE
jgi:transposase